MSTFYYPKNEILAPAWSYAPPRPFPWWVLGLVLALLLGLLLAFLFLIIPWQQEETRKDATVLVKVDYDGDGTWDGQGSGVLISAKGYVLTNKHLIYAANGSKAEKYEIWFRPGRSSGVEKLSAQWIDEGKGVYDLSAENIRNDWAVLRAVREQQFPFLEPAEKQAFQTEEKLRIYGYPNSKESAASANGPSITTPDGSIQRVDAPDGAALRIVHTAVPPDSGMSGGPVTQDGKLIGLMTMARPAPGESEGETETEGAGTNGAGTNGAGTNNAAAPPAPREQYALPAYLLRETVFNLYGAKGAK